MRLSNTVMALVTMAAGLLLCIAVWMASGWLIAGTPLEDLGAIIRISLVFVTLTLLERLYNAIEQRGSSGH